MNRILFVPLLLLSVCSCLSYQPRQARDIFIETGYEGAIGNAEMVLESVTVQKGFDSRSLEDNATYVLELMLLRRNQDSSEPGNPLSLHAFIKEEEYSRNFRTLNTVTVELSVFDPPRSGAVALALYSENTRETIESYAYLHSLIERAFRNLSR